MLKFILKSFALLAFLFIIFIYIEMRLQIQPTFKKLDMVFLTDKKETKGYIVYEANEYIPGAMSYSLINAEAFIELRDEPNVQKNQFIITDSFNQKP